MQFVIVLEKLFIIALKCAKHLALSRQWTTCFDPVPVQFEEEC